MLPPASFTKLNDAWVLHVCEPLQPGDRVRVHRRNGPSFNRILKQELESDLLAYCTLWSFCDAKDLRALAELTDRHHATLAPCDLRRLVKQLWPSPSAT